MNSKVGYCTNVHAGIGLDEVKSNLDRFAVSVRDQLLDSGDLPVGLWLSRTAAEELKTKSQQLEFRDWLQLRKLDAYTFNGFPFDDFHQKIVKHEVYKPSWAEPLRLDYTRRLAAIQSVLLSDSMGTISTLPLGWPESQSGSFDPSFEQACVSNLRALVRFLANLEEQSGKHIRICIEPEPGCCFDRAEHLVRFFEANLLQDSDAGLFKRYLGVCHDVCHSAVMFEPQAHAIQMFQQAGIEIGKVQVSSAVQASFDSADEMQKAWLLQCLAEFNEPRYLHQTSVFQGGKVTFHEDLSLAIGAVEEMPQGVWRVHFHVPIFQSQLGSLQTTQGEIGTLLEAIQASNMQPQWEIETYAWNVLPDEFQGEPLDKSIAREIAWFRKLLHDSKKD